VGQRTFETRSLYLILAEKLFTLPAANEMLPLSALLAGKSREVYWRLWQIGFWMDVWRKSRAYRVAYRAS
jgi:hypothetical protein